MRNSLCILGFGFILSAGVAVAQNAPPAQVPPVNPTTPANQVGDGAQSKSGTPASAPSTTGGVAGTAGASTVQTPEVQNTATGVSAITDSDLESQIQNALSKEPTLSGDSARANVKGDTIVLAGTVGTNKEKVTATRIVQSYAGSKKLENKLTISGRSEKSPTSSDTSVRGRQAGSTANPANNPEPDKGIPPTSKPPQR